MAIKFQKDNLYSQPRPDVGEFIFDDHVAFVFDDMIKRSVPGYDAIINMIGCLAEQYVQEDSICYDLGCSLGAASQSMQSRIDQSNVKIIAVDNSESMVKRCKENIGRTNYPTEVEVICRDIRDVKIQKASIVILNFTLQFIEPAKREDLINKIYEGLLPNGILIISDKIAFEDKQEQEFQTKLHHTFKKLNGYSDLEIAQKRTALEKVLIPDTLAVHKMRLKEAGFKESFVWFQCFNFSSMFAVK